MRCQRTGASAGACAVVEGIPDARLRLPSVWLHSPRSHPGPWQRLCATGGWSGSSCSAPCPSSCLALSQSRSAWGSGARGVARVAWWRVLGVGLRSRCRGAAEGCGGLAMLAGAPQMRAASQTAAAAAVARLAGGPSQQSPQEYPHMGLPAKVLTENIILIQHAPVSAA